MVKGTIYIVSRPDQRTLEIPTWNFAATVTYEPLPRSYESTTRFLNASGSGSAIATADQIPIRKASMFHSTEQWG